MKLSTFYTIAILLLGGSSYAQQRLISTKTFYPKDSVAFENATDFSFQDGMGYERAKFGKTTMIIQAASSAGQYYFVFKKKIKKTDHQVAHRQEVYGTLPDGTLGVLSEEEVPGYTLTDHNLYAFIFVEDHGGLLEKAKFQDFGNAVYWPQFDYKNCAVSDEDGDGIPEFYLSYSGDSDGLDAKPYKQLVYYFDSSHKQVIKAKATALYPAGNEEDVYRVLYDKPWENMPAALQRQSKKIVDSVSDIFSTIF